MSNEQFPESLDKVELIEDRATEFSLHCIPAKLASSEDAFWFVLLSTSSPDVSNPNGFGSLRGTLDIGVRQKLVSPT